MGRFQNLDNGNGSAEIRHIGEQFFAEWFDGGVGDFLDAVGDVFVVEGVAGEPAGGGPGLRTGEVVEMDEGGGAGHRGVWGHRFIGERR